MKGLSLTQPWATLIAIGAKRFETRSWSTLYRGPIAIHAAKSFPRDCQALVNFEPFRRVLLPYLAHGDLPRGAIVATSWMINCHAADVLRLSDQERAFGDFSRGRFAVELVDVVGVNEPVPCTGSLGLWTVPDALGETLRKLNGPSR